jgi:phage-related protein
LIADVLTGVVTIVVKLLQGDWSGAWEAAKELVNNVVGDITGIITNLKDLVLGTIGTLVNEVKNFFQGVYDFLVGGSLIPDLVNEITGLFTGLRDAIFGIFTSIYNTALEIWTNVKNTVVTLVTELHDTAVSLITNAKDLIGGVWDEAYTKATTLWNTLKTDVVTTVTSIKDTIVKLITEAKDALGGVWDEVSKKVTDVWDAIKKYFEDGKQALHDAIMWPFTQAKNVIGTVAQGIKDNIAVPFNAVARGITGFAGGIANAVNWISNKIGLGDLIGTGGLVAVPEFASGVKNFQGGYAIVGENGPELVKLSKGSDVIPADQTKPYLNTGILDTDTTQALMQGASKGWTGIGLGLPGFVSSAVDKVGDLAGSVLDTVKDFIAKGASIVVDSALKAIGVSLNLPKPFDAIGSKIWDTIKSGVVEFTKSLLSSMSDKIPQVPSGAPANYPGGNAILDRAFITKGEYMWCEKFVGDVMQSLGLRYSRMADAATHMRMQPLNPGTGPAGAIVFMPWDTYGHVAFSMGNGQLFGTANTASGTGVQNPLPGAGWTVNPYADGGISTKPNIGFLSEHGQREAVIPLDESNILSQPLETLASFMTQHHLLPNLAHEGDISEVPLELPVINPFTGEEINIYLGKFVLDWLNRQYFFRRGTT